MLETWKPREIGLCDLDDTLIVSEERHMRDCWNHVLYPWGIAWRPDGDQTDRLRMVKEHERPGVGMKPREVLRHFIRLFTLRPDNIQIDLLESTGFIHQDKLLALRAKWRQLSPEEQEEALIAVLEAERLAYAEQRVRTDGVETTPGAVAMIKNWHQAGMGVGIVTQTPLPLAYRMLKAAGLQGYYDVVVSGGMAGDRHKPDPYHLQLAAVIIYWNDLLQGKTPGLSDADREKFLEERRRVWQQRKMGNKEIGGTLKYQLYQEVWRRTIEEYPPAIVCGDSGSDAGAVDGWRRQTKKPIPAVFRLHDYNDPAELEAMLAGKDVFFVEDLSLVPPLSG